MTIADKPVLLTTNIKRWRAFALLAVAFFMVGHRSDDRQHVVADDRPGSALQRDQPAMGGDRLRAHVRRLSAARRSRRGSARPPPDPDARAGRVHGGFAGVRARDRRGVPDRKPGGSGSGRGGHAARRPVDRDEHVPRGRRAQQGARDLGRARCHRRDRRADHRRGSHPVRRMAVHLLSKRPDRGGRAGARTADRPRQPARHDAPAVRRARRDLRHRRAGAARVRDLPGTPVRLGAPRERSRCSRRPRLCSLRSW